MAKVIIRMKGGMGNQLFCYAAARRLALINNAELVIDDVTGFVRDRLFFRQYALQPFCIPVRMATPAERLEPLERYRRGLLKWSARRHPFNRRSYLEQEGLDFDPRVLALKVTDLLYLDGLWQSEKYFQDVSETIRQELAIIPPQDPENQNMRERIANCPAVSIHVRWFDEPNSSGVHNLASSYYEKAIQLMEEKIDTPHYFLFSDNPAAASKKIGLPENRVTFVSHNQGDEKAYADLWLMSQCQHFITANSTFSWWGAWLGSYSQKIVTTPNVKNLQLSGVTTWGFDGLIPTEWILI
jgi:hypothetical protein